MSDLMLDVDQAGELKAAFRRGDWTNREIKRSCEGNLLAEFRQVLLNKASIVPLITVQDGKFVGKEVTAVDGVRWVDGHHTRGDETHKAIARFLFGIDVTRRPMESLIHDYGESEVQRVISLVSAYAERFK